MFAAEGRDLLPMIRARQEQGLEIDEQDQEPEKTPFPGKAIESYIGFSCVAPADTAEEYLMQLWASIRLGLGEGMTGPAPLTWGDLDAYQRVTGYVLPLWIIRIIFEFERSLRRHYVVPGKAVNSG